MTLLLVTGALAGIVIAGKADAEPSQANPTVLAGVWQLNRDLSTPPGGGLGGDQSAPAGGGRRRGGMGGGMGGRRGGAGGPGGRAGGGAAREAQMTQMRDALRELAQPAIRLTIVQHDDAVTFTDDLGRVRKFVGNGKKEKHQLQAATLESKAQWKDGALIIEWETGRGPKVVRTYRTQPQSGQLIVETTIDGGRMGDRPPLRHVYDSVTPAAQ